MGAEEKSEIVGYILHSDGTKEMMDLSPGVFGVTSSSPDIPEMCGTADVLMKWSEVIHITATGNIPMEWDVFKYFVLGIRHEGHIKWIKNYRRCLHYWKYGTDRQKKKNFHRAQRLTEKARRRWGYCPIYKTMR